MKTIKEQNKYKIRLFQNELVITKNRTSNEAHFIFLIIFYDFASIFSAENELWAVHERNAVLATNQCPSEKN